MSVLVAQIGPGRVKEQSSTLVDFLTEFAMSLEVWRRSRSPGRIFGTQRFPRGRDPILSTQRLRGENASRVADFLSCHSPS